MQYFALAFAVGSVLPTAFAQPHGHGHHGHHKPYQSGQVSGAPSASPTSGAPFNLNNGTLSASATGNSQYETLTIGSTLYQTLSSSDSLAPSESALEGGASNADSCAPTTTVTANPTTTVYITGGAAPVQSGVESSAPVKSSVASPIESAVVSSTPALRPVGPISIKSASIAPVESSVAPAPESSPVEVPSQPATSAPVVSSVAPAQPASSAPLNPTTSATPATPPEGASPVAGGDYCANTRDASGNVLAYTGANYTGGVAGKKRGIVFVAGNDAWKSGLYQYANANEQVLWLGNYYSGHPGPDQKDAKGNQIFDAKKTEFVPQMYGKASVGKEWTNNANTAISEGAKYFMSFGEPGTPNPTNHNDPPDGAQLYMDQMQKYTEQGVTIGAPGSLQNKQDWTWEQDFLCDCQKLKCNIGFVAAHWFDDAAPLAQQVERAKGTIETYINVAKGKPLWMDNIWAKGSVADQKAFMDELVPWLEQNTAIERYGWVPQDGPTGTGFTNTDGSVTELGQHYASLGTS